MTWNRKLDGSKLFIVYVVILTLFYCYTCFDLRPGGNCTTFISLGLCGCFLLLVNY